MFSIRSEKPEDIPHIRSLNELAFNGPAEANVVDKLRQDCSDLLSLVAVEGDEIVGHILFSPSVIENAHGSVVGMGLAPMAVAPHRQRQGIGSVLIAHGIACLRERGCPFVIVLGHPKYYPRFGFKPAKNYGLKCQWQGVPDEAFMVIILDENVMQCVSGIACYREEFNEAM